MSRPNQLVPVLIALACLLTGFAGYGLAGAADLTREQALKQLSSRDAAARALLLSNACTPSAAHATALPLPRSCSTQTTTTAALPKPPCGQPGAAVATRRSIRCSGRA